MRNSVINLGDVAAQAGVSKSTASRVLNNKLGKGFSVSDEVRQRVLAVAKQLNYRPNLIAQSLTKQRIRMICVLGGAHALGSLGNIYQTVVNSITKVLDSAQRGFDVTVDMSHHKSDDSELPSWKIEGVIILAKSSSVTFSELEQNGIPYVVVNGPAGPRGSSVIPDDIGGTSLAVRHLIELGHRRIAYAGPHANHLADHISVRNRHQIYLSELVSHGLTSIPGHDQLFNSAVKFLKSAVLKYKATAIVAYGHMEGLNLMQAAHTLGISIPEHLSLICFCEEYANSVMSPGLTFVDLRSLEMGRIAAELLLEKIESAQKNKPKCIKLPEKLVSRRSTAPPFPKELKLAE